MREVRISHSALVRSKIARLMAALSGKLPAHPDAPAKLERSLTELADMAFNTGREFERLQWAQALADIPHAAREAHARGLYQGLEAINMARSLDEARDIIMAISIQIAPVHLRSPGGGAAGPAVPRKGSDGRSPSQAASGLSEPVDRPSGPDGPKRFGPVPNEVKYAFTLGDDEPPPGPVLAPSGRKVPTHLLHAISPDRACARDNRFEEAALDERGSPKPVRKRTDWLSLLIEALGD